MKKKLERFNKTDNKVAEADANNKDDLKMTFLSNAISDISSHIHMADTKVSIIMAITVGLIGSICASNKIIYKSLTMIMPDSCLGKVVITLVIILFLSLIGCFFSGLFTVRSHYSKVQYDSKWFIKKESKEYTIDQYKEDLKGMSDDDIIDNMATELYILNDINRQKNKTFKWVLRLFATALVCIAILFIILAIVAL